MRGEFCRAVIESPHFGLRQALWVRSCRRRLHLMLRYYQGLAYITCKMQLSSKAKFPLEMDGFWGGKGKETGVLRGRCGCRASAGFTVGTVGVSIPPS